ncbi:MAG: 5-methyltetrahydropteroyltriglutamate--homocysteine S-methyltransferase [Rhodospirillales bacterium]|jgi:5-methyltetrahydropteroyltriglutamate--homocysteine methyltransferase|nr:5-methyltetrahydropteroyltriglutamate--homocysteine S-methyltransferase [Rhodospirillaceae bacterium]MDP6428765.1 5-methyltetrahydropteroyltriglutamate--homocysteine S-methyltransferase [Rhodospirillales bacterium]
MTSRNRPPFRADHVGSLLRPEALLESRRKWKAGEMSAEELRAHEDACIKDAVKLQEEAGLEAITDGEFRRESFHVDFISKIKNVTSSWDFDAAVKLGEEHKAGEDKQMPYIPYINGKMDRPDGGIEVENYKYTASLTERMVKITIPSPTMTHFRGGRDAIDQDSYPEMDDFFADMARLYREELADLAAAGCNYVQFDDTNLAYLCDEKMRENARQLGEDPDELPTTYAALINDAIRDRHPDQAVCIHLCRGNAMSQWFASGGYEPVADKLFNLTDVDGFFLEYDDERSGGFEPLRFVPKGGKIIVLGLVTTKRGILESKDELKRRIEEASKYVDLEQLALSPQCGFSSNAVGNLVSVEDEVSKLRLVIETAQEVWG